MNKRQLCLAVAGVCGLLGATAASAVDFQAGDYTLSFSGNVNGFYATTSCDGANNTINGGVACGGANRSAVVRSGLLPSALVFSAKTTQEGYDLNATIGFYPSINADANTGQTATGANPNNNIDARQVFLTFGNKDMGTVKVGRDIGIFGSDAILSDMTLLGVGTGGSYNTPGNTSLGRIGVGYIYTAFQPQITYITPDMNGFQAKAGVFQGIDTSAIGAGDQALTGHSQPQVQAEASYAWKGDVAGKVWVGGMSQQDKKSDGSMSVTGNAYELGGKVDANGFEGVAYYYDGKGVGTTLIGYGALDAAGNKRDSKGYYIQGTYKFTPKTKVGLSYGESKLDATATDVNSGVANTLVAKNKSTVLGVYHNLTKNLLLVGELTSDKSTNGGGQENKDTGIALGAMLSF